MCPPERWPRHEAEEVFEVQLFKHLLKVVTVSLRLRHLLAAARLAHKMEAVAHVAAVKVEAIPVRVDCGNLLLVQLADQNICERLENRGGRVFKEIGNLHVEATVLHTDRTVGVCK